MQQILAEFKAIQEEIRVSESTQLFLAELEMQQGAEPATENTDAARSKLLDVHRDQKLVANELANADQHLDRAKSEEEKKRFRGEIERLKGNIVLNNAHEPFKHLSNVVENATSGSFNCRVPVIDGKD